MKILRWAIASSLVGALFAGTAKAQTSSASPVQQPGSIQQMQFQSDNTGYAAVDSGTTGASPLPASPSNAPPAPPAAKADEKKPEAEKPKEEEKKADETPAPETPYRIFHNGNFGAWEDCEHLEIRGFADIGYTNNPDWPVNRINGPNGYNDRANEFDLNQLYLTAERLPQVKDNCGEDYGYRVDVMFGSDHRFLDVVPGSGWDNNWSTSNYYGFSIPQAYVQYQVNKTTFEVGHFYAPCGYEVANADANQFYSHSYTFLYAEPTTLTGASATYKKSDHLSLNGGYDTGWNEFLNINGRTNFFFGFDWTSSDKDSRIEVIPEVFLGDTSTADATTINGSFRYLFDTVVKVKLGPCDKADKWLYVAENTFAHDSDTPLSAGGTGPASWCSFVNYLIYNMNDCWSAAARYEYMEDLDGAVVAQTGPPAFAEPGSKYNDVTLGLNWKPNLNVTCRTEVRWDWASNTAAPGGKPYGDNFNNSQFTWGNDIIVRF